MAMWKKRDYFPSFMLITKRVLMYYEDLPDVHPLVEEKTNHRP
ncbi:hypothetical protein [Sutcliffiella horikoshii]|nr:hypothetical protein [Sutcliffiella horikoshii]